MQRGWAGEVAGLFFFFISKAASRHNCSSKLGKFCSRFAFAFTAKIISDVHWWGGYKPPHLFFLRQCLFSSSRAPQWFVLPVAWWESHGTDVNHGKFCKECLQMFKHIVVGRHYVNKPLDYADIKIYSLGRYIGNYPSAIQPSWYHWTDGILFIPLLYLN